MSLIWIHIRQSWNLVTAAVWQYPTIESANSLSDWWPLPWALLLNKPCFYRGLNHHLYKRGSLKYCGVSKDSWDALSRLAGTNLRATVFLTRDYRVRFSKMSSVELKIMLMLVAYPRCEVLTTMIWGQHKCTAPFRKRSRIECASVLVVVKEHLCCCF